MPTDQERGYIPGPPAKSVELALFRMGSLPALAIYLGIGALLHALVVGPHFNWSSAWTWGWLLGWPVAIFIAFWGFILALVGIGIILAIIVMIMESSTVMQWRNNRMMRRIRKKISRERRT